MLSPAASLYHGQDQIGSTRDVLVMPGDTNQTYDYDAYRSALSTTGTGLARPAPRAEGRVC